MLAAGRGERLRPLTDATPKALLPVGGVPLLDRAIARLEPYASAIAVNAHYRHEQVVAHLAGRDVHVSVEMPEALGTAGALGRLREWIDGRDVLVTNVDGWYDSPVPNLAGADGRMRLLVVDEPARPDYGTWRYAGCCFLPWPAVASLEATPSGLHEVCWRAAWATNSLDLVPFTGGFIDCGTPADYEAANRAAAAHG